MRCDIVNERQTVVDAGVIEILEETSELVQDRWVEGGEPSDKASGERFPRQVTRGNPSHGAGGSG